MDDKPLISVITPARIQSKVALGWLRDAIRSVLAQKEQRWELIVVNDHSTIGWQSIGELFKDERIRGTVTDNDEPSVSFARNKAASLARSKLLLPLDADDMLVPASVSRFLEVWNNGGSKKGIVYSDVMMFNEGIRRRYSPPEYDFGRLLQNTFMTVGCLHRKADWHKCGGWNAELDMGLEDWEYWIKFGEMGICGHRVSQPLYWYRRHPRGRLADLRTEPSKWHLAYQKLRSMHKETYNGRWPEMCCGGSRRRSMGLPPTRDAPQSRKLPIRNPVMIEYRGKRKGSFGVTGQVSRRRYRVSGGKRRIPVDPRDAPQFKKFNGGRDFRVVAP